MFRFQPKITHHINNQEYLKWNLKGQLIDANTEITEMRELSDKDLELVFIKFFNKQLRILLKQKKK